MLLYGVCNYILNVQENMRHYAKDIHRLDLAADYVNKQTLLFLLKIMPSLLVRLVAQIWALKAPFWVPPGAFSTRLFYS